MRSHSNVRSIVRPSEQVFNVIEKFAELSSKRKTLLCDTLFEGHAHSFENAVSVLWPEAQSIDVKKLEKFLLLLRKTAY